MLTKSCSSENIDPYRAGLEIGLSLKGISPEIIILFTSIHYRGNPELLEGIYDATENDELLIFGNSGDGVLETNFTSDIGVSALGINSNGKIHYKLCISDNNAKGIESCLKDIHHDIPASCEPKIVIIASGISTDGSMLVNLINKYLTIPIIGGLAGDDRRMESSFIYINRQVLKDSTAFLLLSGEFNFDIHVAGNLTPVGRTGIVTRSNEKQVQEISGMPAMAFIEEEAGKPVTNVDKGITAFLVADPLNPGQIYLRSIADINERDKTISLFGAIIENSSIQLCYAQTDKIIDEVRNIGALISRGDFEPKAGIIISCAGRKWVLGNKIDHEIKALFDGSDFKFPIIGYPSFGEFGPRKLKGKYTQNLFHNVTYITLILGD